MSDEASSLILFLSMNVASIIIGLVIWLVVPILVNDSVKKKAHRKALSLLCRIVGIAIIAVSIFNFLMSMLS